MIKGRQRGGDHRLELLQFCDVCGQIRRVETEIKRPLENVLHMLQRLQPPQTLNIQTLDWIRPMLDDRNTQLPGLIHNRFIYLRIQIPVGLDGIKSIFIICPHQLTCFVRRGHHLLEGVRMLLPVQHG